MTLFELEFGLTAIILGLALTRLASNLHSLILAGRRVRWAPEPLLLCGIIFEVTIVVWLAQWGLRGGDKDNHGHGRPAGAEDAGGFHGCRLRSAGQGSGAGQA